MYWDLKVMFIYTLGGNLYLCPKIKLAFLVYSFQVCYLNILVCTGLISSNYCMLIFIVLSKLLMSAVTRSCIG